jgi:hypothetical protein
MDAEITKKRKGRKAFVVIANLASRGVAISGINSPSAFEIATVAALLRNDNVCCHHE